MALQILDLATLTAMRQRVVTIEQFWRAFFPRQINFETPYIDFERANRRYKSLAPFVAPNVQGRVVRRQGSKMERLSPAYIKMKAPVDASMVIQRVPGEAPYQPLSNAQRRLAVIGEIMRDHDTRFQNRLEWLGAKAIIDAAVTISGEDYPAQTVNFNRDPSLTVVLAGAAKWDQTTAKPLLDIRSARRNAFELSGSKIRRLIFGTNAWELFATRLGFDNPQSGNLLDTRFRGSDTDISRVLDGFDGAEFVGYVQGRNGQGQLECWVYSQTYDDENGVSQDFLNPNDVIGVGAVDGVQMFGAIHDAEAGYRAMSYFQKNWVENDPSVEYILGQSAPLLVPGEPNATFRIRVA